MVFLASTPLMQLSIHKITSVAIFYSSSQYTCKLAVFFFIISPLHSFSYHQLASAYGSGVRQCSCTCNSKPSYVASLHSTCNMAKLIGASAASPTLVVKTENCLFIYMVRAYSVYIYILPHLCAMQYFYIACWFM